MKFLYAILLFVFCSAASATDQPCTQTFSNATGLDTAIANAANGSVICLNNGDYGTVNLFNMHRTGYVTIRSTTGQGATFSPQVGDSRFMRFLNLTLTGITVNSCSLNIQFVNSTFVQNQSGLYFDGSSCPSTVQNYLVDGVVFDTVGQANFEGRLNCRDCNGAIFRNSTFKNIVAGNASDGIQTQGNTQNFTIGPNNIFTHILEADCGTTHCDCIQLQGGGTTLITGNYFSDASTMIMAPDGTSNVTVSNNVFDGLSDAGSQFKIQMGTAASPIFEHNTLYGAQANFDSKNTSSPSTNAIVRNNIFVGGLGPTTDGGNCNSAVCCTSCSFTFNLTVLSGFDLTACSSCTNSNNSFSTTPTFTGGSHPSTWTGWKLTSGSAGHNAGSDGKDIGANYWLGGASVPNIR